VEKERTLADYKKPIPDGDPYEAGPYWEGLKQNKFMLPRCVDCNRAHFYPRILCPLCGSRNIEWFEASGEGYLHTFAVQHRAFGGWAEEAPFITAFIDLKEGDRMLTVLRGADPTKPEELMKKIGSLCKVEFEKANDNVTIPFWRIVD
jgi:hypothetical protein